MEENLNRFGYELLEIEHDPKGYFSKATAKKYGDEIFLVLERLEERYIDTFICRLKIIGNSNVDTTFKIRRKNRDFATAIKKSGVLDDYEIKADNEQEIAEFLSHERIFPAFEDLITSSIDDTVEVNSKGGKFLIRLKTDCNYTVSLRSIPSMESMVWIFQGGDNIRLVISGLGKYQCDNCKELVPLTEEICQECGIKAPHCVICLKAPGDDETLFQLKCCDSYVHQKELRYWMEIKNSCPNCRSKEPKIKSVTGKQ